MAEAQKRIHTLLLLLLLLLLLWKRHGLQCLGLRLLSLLVLLVVLVLIVAGFLKVLIAGQHLIASDEIAIIISVTFFALLYGCMHEGWRKRLEGNSC